MKTILGASAIFYFLLAAGFIVLFLAVPYPHYNLETNGWFLGTPVGARILGNKEVEGVPLDRIATRLARSSITSPLELYCESNSDCKEYVVINQCASHCGNNSSENNRAVAMLSNQRICDPALWRKLEVSCKCVSGKCISF